MANFLDSLLDKDNPVRKLQKEIEGVEFKKQSLISAVQGEITAAKQKIDNEILQIGGNIYTRYINGTYTDSELAAHFAAIDAGNNTIKEKESKIAEIAGRYDEELNLLKMNLAALAPPPQPPQYPGAVCPVCQRPFTPGVDIFCMGCGNKLDAPAAPAAPPPQYTGAVCPVCQRPFTPGADMFCMGCGNKLGAPAAPAAPPPVSAAVLCPGCGAAHSPGDMFCVECGQRLG